jgi:peptide chain release factor 3
MFGGERSTLDLAFAGDIVGVVNPGVFSIGDSLSGDGTVRFQSMPKFPPEVVARVRPKDVMRRKSFEKGMEQFRSEGAILILQPFKQFTADPLAAAVGPLQFEVLQNRLQTEYNVESVFEQLPFRYGAWLVGEPENFKLPSNTMLAVDADGKTIFLYGREWEKQHALERNPGYELKEFIAAA